ncbi:hypothetical protein JW960_09195 [candidate division KSB1 bacterium]|nr:hypothetical protein [candidate division KSB1 bacterium]
MSREISIVEHSTQKLETWIEQQNYKGFEPFDGLTSFFRPLTCGNALAERIFLQAVRQSPVNIRPLLGIKPHESTKGRGYMAAGYLNMLMLDGNHQYKNKAINCLNWLIENKSPGYCKYCWGNHFDWTNREGKLPKFEPTIVWTSLVGQAFLDAYEVVGNRKYLDIASSISDWILSLPREETNSGACISYVACGQSFVHNSNLLGAAMLARTAKYTNDDKALHVARKAIEYSCSRQLSNGAWYYGEWHKHLWIDNFHTGYNLDSLKCYIEHANDWTFEKNLTTGFEYFRNTFFESDGRPRYYHDRTYPIDIQCAAQAIDTLANFSDYDATALPLSLKVATWTIENMQDKNGYFYYRQFPRLKVKIPMLHWGQATMYKALTHLLLKL